MKKLFRTLLAVLVLSLLACCAFAEEPAADELPHDPNGIPTVFYQGNTVVSPGHAVGIRGEYLDQAWTATLSDGEKSAEIELLQQNRQSFKFIIPEDFAKGIYTLTLAGEKPLTIVINEPRVQWLHGDEGSIATAGGWVRAQGECLFLNENGQPTLTLTAADGTVTTLNAEKVYDAYSVQFAIPELAQGDYKAVYSNGFAARDAGTLTIGVTPESTWLTKVYDVTKYKVDNTGVQDATAMLNVLLGHIGNTGGGVLYFPEGRYLISGTLTIPARVIMRGAGVTKSQLFWQDTWREVKKYEDGYSDMYQTDAPALMSAPNGNIVIENLDFAGGHTGSLLVANVGNVRIENCRANMNAYVGTEYGWHQNYYKSILHNEASNAYFLFRFSGSNFQVINSEFTWTHSMQLVNMNCRTEYLHIAGNEFIHDGPTNGGFSFDNANYSIFEDNFIHGCTIGGKGDNIYFARTHTEDATTGDNRESFTSDVGGGLQKFQQGLDIGADGVTFTFPEAFAGIADVVKDSQGRKWGLKLLILDGTGEGQWRYITACEGRTITIESPFTVAPDASSRFCVNTMYTNWYIVDVEVENGGMFQFYTAQGNTVIDGMKIKRAAGIKLYGQQTYSKVGNNWYCSVVNCSLSDGNYYHTNGYMDYWMGNRDSKLGTSQRLPGGSFIAAVGTPGGGNQPTYNMCCTIRDNTLTENSLIYLFSNYEKSLEDCIVDGNFSYDTRCGIYIEGTPGRLLLNNNTTENVPTPVDTFPYDPAQYKPQFE